MKQKIILAKNEEVDAAVEKVAQSIANEVALVIPTRSMFGSSISNFRLLKREAAAHGKLLSVESVDENVLALAHAAGIEAIHPILTRGVAGAPVMDIIPAAASFVAKPRVAAKKGSSKKPALRMVRDEEKKSEPEPERISKDIPREEPPEETPPPRTRRTFSFRWKKPVGVLMLIILIIGGGAWSFAAFFGKARAVIRFKQSPLTYEGTITASKSVAIADLKKNILPAEVFSDNRNLTQLFPASGRGVVSEKATGKIIITNAYSSSAQSLVATTRFMTPEGKILRLVDSVVVPGAHIVDGKITPATVEAVITADKPGADYNISATPRLTIPGFKGTPKYDGFYGAIAEPLRGGATGERPVPTDDDIVKAKAKVTDLLRASLTNNLTARRPQGIVVPEGASETTVTKLTVMKATDDKGNFSVFGEAHFRAIGFRESDLRALVFTNTTSDPALIIKDIQLSYSNVRPNFDKGELQLVVAAQGTLTQSFPPDEFKKKLYGKNAQDARSMILALPGIADATLSFWPRWLVHIPSRSERVEIVVP